MIYLCRCIICKINIDLRVVYFIIFFKVLMRRFYIIWGRLKLNEEILIIMFICDIWKIKIMFYFLFIFYVKRVNKICDFFIESYFCLI